MGLISIVIPTINEEKAIGETIDKIKKSLRNYACEIIVVDTNSIDKTVKISKSRGATVVIEPRRGYGRAYKTGFKHARGEIIVTLDADATYPPESIPKLINFLKSNKLDFVSGRRLAESSMSISHKIGNWLITKTANMLFGTPFKDSQSGMWAFRRQILENLKLTNDSWPFSGEIKIEAILRGFRFSEYPVEYRIRKGSSKVRSWFVGWENMKFLFWKLVNK